MEDNQKGPSNQDTEFEQVVKVKDIKETKKSEPVEEVTLPIAQPVAKTPIAKPEAKAGKVAAREPKIEDAVGFNGRRPMVDPFRPGEKVVMTAKYLNVEAGDVAFEVLPFKNVNDRKAYHLRMNIKTNRTFNMFYAVDNTSETYLDYEAMTPQTFTYDAKESSRIREYKIFFDNKKLEATQWKREVHKKKGEKKNKISWPIEPYSQNILSALFYLRTFQLEPGQKYSFRVADEGKNYVFTFNVLRREKLETSKGLINTLVIRPDYQVDGTFKPSGENTVWVTDDSRKFVVQIAAKVKIGTFMLKLKSIEGPK
jgi:hypothetical protein